MPLTSFRPERIIAVILLSLGLFLQGCSHKAWYEGFQQRQRQDCYERGSQSDVQGCLEKANMNYDQYKNSREETLKK